MNKEELHRYVRGILGQPEPIHFAHSMIETLERALEASWQEAYSAGAEDECAGPGHEYAENPWRKQ